MNIQGIGQQYMGMTTQMMNRNQGGVNPADMDVGQLIKKADQNGDGVLSIDETPMSEDMFGNADADGDGLLTQAEMEEMLASGPPPGMGGGMMGMPGMGGLGGGPDIQSLLSREDQDEDGSISSEETGLPEALFSKLDADGDGKVTAEELEQARAEKETGMSQGSLTQTTAASAYQSAVTQYLSYLEVDENASLSSFMGTVI